MVKSSIFDIMVAEADKLAFNTNENLLDLEDKQLQNRIEDAVEMDSKLEKTSIRSSSVIQKPQGAIEAFNENLATAIDKVLIKGDADFDTIGEDELSNIVMGMTTPFGSKGKMTKGLIKRVLGKTKKGRKIFNELQYRKNVVGNKILDQVERSLPPRKMARTVKGKEIKLNTSKGDPLHGQTLTGPKSTELTLYGKYQEGKAARQLYRTLATKKEYAKFKNTYQEGDRILNKTKFGSYFKQQPFPKTYLEYKDYLKDRLLKNRPETKIHKGTWPSDIVEGKNTLGSFTRNELLRPIEMATSTKWTNIGKPGASLTPSKWRSTYKHEMKHMIDYDLGQFKFPELNKMISKNILPKVKDRLERWQLQEDYAKHVLGIKGGKQAPSDVSMYKYLLKPYEVLARLTQIKSAGGIEKAAKTFGNPGSAYIDLNTVFSKKTIEKLLKEHWAVAPVGLGKSAYDAFEEQK